MNKTPKDNLYIIAGCNGAGKTTASFTILPEIINCKEFVNADEIAKGLSPFQPESVSFEAGRIMINRVNELLSMNKTFAFETTLASKTYKNKILQAQKNGYTVTLLFFWLQSIDLAIERVKNRVLEGGHHIESEIVIRRYHNGIKNLFRIYLPIADEVMIFDNSEGMPELIAEKTKESELHILNKTTFNKLNDLK
ncbi:MAG: zeta toxin [Flavobacterium sp. BFFFF2]|nr:MAG: zeta toxin [Flavobacterium sp. BFFFF2]